MTKYSATLIDNIFTNDINSSNLKIRIHYCGLSDHLPIALVIDTKKLIKIKESKIYMKRDMCEQNYENFIVALQEENWSDFIVNTLVEMMLQT